MVPWAIDGRVQGLISSFITETIILIKSSPDGSQEGRQYKRNTSTGATVCGRGVGEGWGYMDA